MTHLSSRLAAGLPAALLVALLAGPAQAQQQAAASPTPAAASASGPATGGAPSADMADGEIRRIDREGGRVTLRHGEIRNLEMPPMTMVFQAQEPALLDKLKVGDKVKFRAEKSGSRYIVTAIEAAK